jgi:ABC-2 type transport system permease protein
MTAATVPTAGPVRAPAMPSALRLGLVRTVHELRLFSRERDAVFFIFLYPILMLAIFSTVFGKQNPFQGTGLDVTFAQLFLPGMIATGVMLSSFQSLSIFIAVERDERLLKRLRGTPLPASSYFLGKIGQVLVTSVVQTALLLLVAATAFHVPMPTDAAKWWTFAWVFVLGTAAGSVCGVAFSSVPRSGKSASAVVTPIVLVLQFISGVFFQFDQLPHWMQTIASLFPLKWMAQGMRSVFLPDGAAQYTEPSGSWQHGATAAILVAYLVIGLVAGARTFRWLRRDEG